MEKLPTELIHHISEYLAIEDITSLSETCKANEKICNDIMKKIFNQVFPRIYISDNNYVNAITRYIEAINDSPLYDIIRIGSSLTLSELTTIGCDSFSKILSRVIDKSNINKDILILPFISYPYNFRKIYLACQTLLPIIADILPDIESGKPFPTGLYIKTMLRLRDIRFIVKLLDRLSRPILIKWLVINLDDIYGILSIYHPKLESEKILADELDINIDELLLNIGDIISLNNYIKIREIFKLSNEDMVFLAIRTLNIQILARLNLDNVIINRSFVKDVLDISSTDQHYSYIPDNEKDNLVSIISNNQIEYRELIYHIVYRLFDIYPEYIYQAAVWWIMKDRKIYNMVPVELDYAEELYYYLANYYPLEINLMDLVNNDKLFKFAINIQYFFFESYRYINNTFIVIRSDLINYLYNENNKLLDYVISMITTHGLNIDFSGIKDDVLNKMDFIGDLSNLNNYRNKVNYIKECINRNIYNNIFEKLINQPECIGMLLHSPNCRKYIDKIRFNEMDIKRKWLIARRSANLFIINRLNNIQDLEYLLSKLIPISDVNRYLIRILGDKFIYYPNARVNIESIIFDIKAIKILADIEYPINNVKELIKKYINIYPLSCEVLAQKYIFKNNYNLVNQHENFFISLGSNGRYIISSTLNKLGIEQPVELTEEYKLNLKTELIVNTELYDD